LPGGRHADRAQGVSQGATVQRATRRGLPKLPLIRPQQFDVVLYGDKYLRWMRLLDRDPIWTSLPQVLRVTHRRDDWRPTSAEQHPGRQRLVIPLHEHNIAATPLGCWALIPSPRGLRTFADKKRFWTFAAACGLGSSVPRTYAPGSEVFPLVLKRTNLCASKGVALVRSRADLMQRLGEPLWQGRPVLLQEFIDGEADYVTHAVCVDGRVAWHRSYSYPTVPGAMLMPRAAPPIDAEIGEQDLNVLRRFVEPVAFSGPVSVDFRRRPDGRLAILEINPRFGGSLFWPHNRPHLREALEALIANVRWLSPVD
jgi:hypothetical protein